jgi:hypothetical protein
MKKQIACRSLPFRRQIVGRLVTRDHDELDRERRQMDRPVGGGFGKAFQLGGQPLKLDFDAYCHAVRPKAGNETWLLQAKLTFQFPD